MIFYDMEVFKYDWLGVFIDPFQESVQCIRNDSDALAKLYEERKTEIWCGYNNRHYDQYIFKGILLGMDPKPINDWIIVQHGEGWQYSDEFRSIDMINYDCMPNPPVGLKTMESFLGSDVRETEIPFNIDRKLTEQELNMTEHYCQHDVEETIKVFLQTIDVFEAKKGIIEAFPDQVSLSDIGSSEARMTAKVLECHRQSWDDEFDIEFESCIQLNKYKYVQNWFSDVFRQAREMDLQHKDESVKKLWYKKTNLEATVAGIPHTFGFGGIHGACDGSVHFGPEDGVGYHVDVNNYYPSYLIAHDRITRSAGNQNYQLVYKTRKAMKMKQLAAKTKEEAKQWKKAQLPYKKMLNALSGAMKDKTNAAYDPKMNNCMCVNGQLMLLDLIEHLEVIPGFRLVQSNTDGLIVWIPDTDTAFNQLDDICYDWECRCSTKKCDIGLALDNVKEIYQKDVNNYLWVEPDGSVESIGTYLKPLSPIDFDLPILNKALHDYMVDKVPVEKTINDCNDLIMFQHCVKLSDSFRYVEHEEGEFIEHQIGKRKIRITYEYPNAVRYTYKCYRVFASTDLHDGRLIRCGGQKVKQQKFGNTSDHSFIWNDDVSGVKVPKELDKQWYINLARKRLKDYGVTT